MRENRAAGKAALVLTDRGALQTDLGTQVDAALSGTRFWHCTGREYGMLAPSSASKVERGSASSCALLFLWGDRIHSVGNC